MKQLKILIHTYIGKLYKNKNKMHMEVPTICISRAEKDHIILSTIEHLEQTIKIKQNE
jgi:hypothetical protein